MSGAMHARLAMACIACGLAMLPPGAPAQMHMCKDAQGRKVYSVVPCGPDSQVIDVRPAGGGAAINPDVAVRVEHYDIRGTTFEALVREIDAKGPEGWWGDASTRMSFTMQTRVGPGGCAPASVRTTADARVRLPVWTNRFEGPRNLQVYWDGLYRSLDLHERGHVRISVEGTQQMERALKAIAEQPTCEALYAQAKQVADAIAADVGRKQAQYDAETDHGRRQWTPYRD